MISGGREETRTTTQRRGRREEEREKGSSHLPPARISLALLLSTMTDDWGRVWDYVPYSFCTVCGSLTSHRLLGTSVVGRDLRFYRPYPKRLYRKAIYLQMSLQREHFLLECWCGLGLNPLPLARWSVALPTMPTVTDLTGRRSIQECTYNRQ